MRHKDDNKEGTIRQKAIEMIVQEGFDGLSMQKLARAANISPSTIYTYFDSREDLVNKLYLGVEQQFEKDALIGYKDEMTFEAFLWTQWKNRYRNIKKDPVAYHFFEQFRYSPLIRHQEPAMSRFKDAMNKFVQHAMDKKRSSPSPWKYSGQSHTAPSIY
ncbi:TetR/AcrR family transcriptional regulator [Chitinophaga sp. MD30]|uniref:TetR/AcrR family transcriptional regulator n=1 Tax=Chitinophaga sp. MD30 TaxID=2033437 RepID=UPI001E3B0425|nr:TetR/AcrR family transcriptional regulator [Chitinophaga sp. MD30]